MVKVFFSAIDMPRSEARSRLIADRGYIFIILSGYPFKFAANVQMYVHSITIIL